MNEQEIEKALEQINIALHEQKKELKNYSDMLFRIAKEKGLSFSMVAEGGWKS